MQEIKVIVAQLKTLERNIDQLIVDCERVKAESDKLKKEKSVDAAKISMLEKEVDGLKSSLKAIVKE